MRITRLLDDLALSPSDVRITTMFKSLASVELLTQDERGFQLLITRARHDLLEILDDRYGRKSIIMTSQPLTASWHHVIGDSTYADAILDRLLHNAHRIELEGDSLLRTKASVSDNLPYLTDTQSMSAG